MLPHLSNEIGEIGEFRMPRHLVGCPIYKGPITPEVLWDWNCYWLREAWLATESGELPDDVESLDQLRKEPHFARHFSFIEEVKQTILKHELDRVVFDCLIGYLWIEGSCEGKVKTVWQRWENWFEEHLANGDFDNVDEWATFYALNGSKVVRHPSSIRGTKAGFRKQAHAMAERVIRHTLYIRAFP